jgi:tRNA pseudouridine38-40 synthase
MAHYKLILAYEGTQYHGFQRQKNKTSVQAEVEAALRKLGWQGRAVIPAGRTDSGVHALGQVVSFRLDWKHGDGTLLRALNAHLPDDIVVQAVSQAAENFHPRYDALRRTYVYRIYWQEARNPLIDRFAWHLTKAPSLERMNLAAGLLLGEHDFRAFGKALKTDGTTIRQVYCAEWQPTCWGAAFTIQGHAFLYHMVRRIVYILVHIGLGKLPEGIIERGLETGITGIVSLAPARGLTLQEVAYREDNEIN